VERAEVAVVGAGVTGLSLAFFLASDGADVVILERSSIAAEASGIQPGGVRQQWSTRVNCVLAREATRFYESLSDQLHRRVDAQLERCGYLFVAVSDGMLESLRANVALQNELGIPSRLVDPDEAAELVPGLATESMTGASWCDEDGYFDKPQTVVEAFAAAAQERGARLQIREVDRIERDGDSWRVETRSGPLLAGQVVVAAGVDTPRLLAPLGAAVPIEAEARHLFFSEPVTERLVEPLVVVGERGFAAKQLANGRVLSSDLAAAGDPTARREEWRRTVAAGIAEFLPVLSFVSFPIFASGYYDLTADHQPIVGAVPGNDGVWMAAGYSGHGFMLAPAISRRLASAVLEGAPARPIEEFALDRFDGTGPSVESQIV
jgi:sarcosine oxidase subunit beta